MVISVRIPGLLTPEVSIQAKQHRTGGSRSAVQVSLIAGNAAPASVLDCSVLAVSQHGSAFGFDPSKFIASCQYHRGAHNCLIHITVDPPVVVVHQDLVPRKQSTVGRIDGPAFKCGQCIFRV